MQHLKPNTTLQGGKYRIERVLGQGGFGNTYMAKNTVFDDHVAIKEFFMQGVNGRDENSGSITIGIESNTQQFEEQREKFKKEARRLWKLKNEHIIKVHDLFEENGTAYYVMDYIDGESLAERMRKTGQSFTEAEVRNILSQILEALKEVHQNDIWHLDLKPGNIMMDKSGKAYLIDFGASKQIRANGSMTTSTALCYTPGYAPNEQIGQMYDRFGPWTDIYALGATIYTLLTNKKPPMGIDIEEDEEDAFDFPVTVPDEMRKLVIWMMQPKRKARPQHVDEIITRMEGVNVKPQPKAEKPVISTAIPIDSEETILVGSEPIQKQIDADFVEENNAHAVDLGLSVLWADCNIGATMQMPQGRLYGWGDKTGSKTSGKVEDYLDFKGGMYLSTPNNISGTEYDISSELWGKQWRIPTTNEWSELINKCTWLFGEFEQMKGYNVIGPNGNSIFLPFSGNRIKETIFDNDKGLYWTSELVPSEPTYAFCYYFDQDKHNDDVVTRSLVFLGHAIRPVCDK